jgi:hypothetical protein
MPPVPVRSHHSGEAMRSIARLARIAYLRLSLGWPSPWLDRRPGLAEVIGGDADEQLDPRVHVYGRHQLQSPCWRQQAASAARRCPAALRFVD